MKIDVLDVLRQVDIKGFSGNNRFNFRVKEINEVEKNEIDEL